MARLLDNAGIGYELVPYQVDENDLSADSISRQLGIPLDMIFKTLVLAGDNNELFVCVIPGSFTVDLKFAARLSGHKSCDLIPMKDLLKSTGYIRGGCSPIGMKKQFPTYIHESCFLYDHIYVSAGVRGLQLKIAPDDLIRFISAEIYPI